MVAAVVRVIPLSLHVDALLVDDDAVTIRAISESPTARCPLCGDPTDRTQSCFTRILADVP